MTSSKLYKRRVTPAKPHVCHPPPPPPLSTPPPPFPADPITTHIIIDWDDWDGHHHLDDTIDAPRIGTTWDWAAIYEGDGYTIYINYELHPDTQTARIAYSADEGASSAFADRDALPITWDVSTLYILADFDYYYPSSLTITATFRI